LSFKPVTPLKKQKMLHAVIMAGGQGTRLWPESRKERPKQFLALHNEKTLLQNAAESLNDLIPPERVIIVTGKTMLPMVEESVPSLKRENILLEPTARNTAPCLGLAAIFLLKNDPDATMAVLPSDHVIQPYNVFCNTIRFAAELVEESPQYLVTLAVRPTHPSTAYGYIERKKKWESPISQKWSSFADVYQVSRFLEKPDKETAEKFVKSGNFGWNAGIFVWKAKRLLDLINSYQPEMGRHLQNIATSWNTTDYDDILEKEFEQMKPISIDYAILEKTESLLAIDANFFWDDVGSWSALERLNQEKFDNLGNLTMNCQATVVDSHNNIIRGNAPTHPIVLVDVNNMIIVQSEHGLLIADKSSEEKIRTAIAEMEKKV